MPKISVPDSALEKIAGDEMVRLRKENDKLNKKIIKLEHELSERKARDDFVKGAYEEINSFIINNAQNFDYYYQGDPY
jgi:hypothetical protein